MRLTADGLDYDGFLQGLVERGYVGMGLKDGDSCGECNLGGCHTPDDKHYILVTDGMVIYSDFWDHNANSVHSVWYDPLRLITVVEWSFEEFSFDKLDDVIWDKFYKNLVYEGGFL